MVILRKGILLHILRNSLIFMEVEENFQDTLLGCMKGENTPKRVCIVAENRILVDAENHGSCSDSVTEANIIL